MSQLMGSIESYCVIQSNNLAELISKTNAHIYNGWFPLGGISVCATNEGDSIVVMYYQAVGHSKEGVQC